MSDHSDRDEFIEFVKTTQDIVRMGMENNAGIETVYARKMPCYTKISAAFFCHWLFEKASHDIDKNGLLFEGFYSTVHLCKYNATMLNRYEKALVICHLAGIGFDAEMPKFTLEFDPSRPRKLKSEYNVSEIIPCLFLLSLTTVGLFNIEHVRKDIAFIDVAYCLKETERLYLEWCATLTPEFIEEQVRIYDAKKEEQIRIYDAKKEAENKPIRIPITNGLRFDILKKDNYTCQICGASKEERARLEIDHIIPVSKGGTNDPCNLQTLCFSCNRGKHAKEM